MFLVLWKSEMKCKWIFIFGETVSIFRVSISKKKILGCTFFNFFSSFLYVLKCFLQLLMNYLWRFLRVFNPIDNRIRQNSPAQAVYANSRVGRAFALNNFECLEAFDRVPRKGRWRLQQKNMLTPVRQKINIYNSEALSLINFSFFLMINIFYIFRLKNRFENM